MPIPRWIRARDDHAARSLGGNLFEMSHIFRSGLNAGNVGERQNTGPNLWLGIPLHISDCGSSIGDMRAAKVWSKHVENLR